MNRLRELRLKAGLTQLEMAKRLNISESFYCQLENGKRGIKVPMALNIAGILGTTVEDIFLPENMAERQEYVG